MIGTDHTGKKVATKFLRIDLGIYERHERGHRCSICEQVETALLPVGVLIPKAKVFNAWWWVRLSTKRNHYYWRRTFRFLPHPERTHHA